MKRYSVLDALVLSFHSKPLYQDVARNWRGTGFPYLLLLLAICWVPEMAKLQIAFSNFVSREGTQLVKQIPAINIKDGEVSTDVPTPYFIKDPAKGKVLVVIDLTGEYTSLDDTAAGVLLTRHKVFTRNKNEVRTYDLKDLKSFHLDKYRVQGWMDLARTWLVVILFPIVLIFSFVYRIVQALIYGLCGMVLAKIVKVELGYLTLLRLAVVAVTPAVVLETARSVASIHIPFWSLLCFAIAMGYLYVAITASAAPETAAPGQPIG